MMSLGIRVSICDHPIQPNFVQIWTLKLQHLKNASSVDFICSIFDFLRCTIRTSKTRVDKLVTVFLKKFKGSEVSAGRDLDKLCKTVSNLSFGQSAQKPEIEECMLGCMVRAETVLVISSSLH